MKSAISVKNLFSLIVCSYNPKPGFLERALKSAEGLFDEVIIVDDGSDTPLECATIRHEINLGLYKARNTGISAAKGNIICLLDDDDELIPEEVLKMKEWVNNTEADIYTHKVLGINCMEYNFSKILDNNQLPGVSWYKKKVWEDLGGYTYSVAEDWDFWARAIKEGKDIKIYPGKPFYKFNFRPDSVSANWTGNKFEEIRNEIRLRNNY